MTVGLDVKASFLLFLGVNVGRRLGSKGKRDRRAADRHYYNLTFFEDCIMS